MKKRVFGKKLSRSRTAREALYRSLFRSLVEYGAITTTEAKAKALARYADRLINTAKKDDLVSRRRVLASLANDVSTTKVVVEKIAPLYKRKSGYTRLTPLPKRRGDNTKKFKVEWIKKISSSDSKEKREKKQDLKSKKNTDKTKKSK